MSNPFIGEIRIFAGNFPPVGWMFCEGQLLPISENDALFVLLGTTYGGDGQETFALPDLRGRLPMHAGQGPGLQNYILGASGGVEQVTLTTQQIPVHNHTAGCLSTDGNSVSPTGGLPAVNTTTNAYGVVPPAQPMNVASITPSGGSQPHTNFQPYLCVNFIISLFGIFPSQT
jgi:microcystin-dependent protein